MIKSSLIALMRCFPTVRGFLQPVQLHIAFGVESGWGYLALFIEAPYTDITPKKYISVISQNTELFPWN